MCILKRVKYVLRDEKGIFNVVYQVIRDRLTNIDYNPVHKLNVTADIETTYMDKAVDNCILNQVFEPVSPQTGLQ